MQVAISDLDGTVHRMVDDRAAYSILATVYQLDRFNQEGLVEPGSFVLLSGIAEYGTTMFGPSQMDRFLHEWEELAKLLCPAELVGWQRIRDAAETVRDEDELALYLTFYGDGIPQPRRATGRGGWLSDRGTEYQGTMFPPQAPAAEVRRALADAFAARRWTLVRQDERCLAVALEHREGDAREEDFVVCLEGGVYLLDHRAGDASEVKAAVEEAFAELGAAMTWANL